MSGIVRRFRLSALFPFVLSCVSFALLILLVVSGSNPGTGSDGYLLRFNTTTVGQNLVQFNPANATTTSTAAVLPTSVNAARDIHPALPNHKISYRSSDLNSQLLTARDSNSTSLASNTTVPTLAIPQTSAPPVPGALPVSVIGAFFQVTLNSFASGMGQALQSVVSLLVTTGKSSLDVNQFYTFHAFGLCEGSVVNAGVVNTTNPLNITRCMSYSDTGTFLQNLTTSTSPSTFVGALNITIPALTILPALGRSTKSLIDLFSTIVKTIFILSLLGNGLSIILSATLFFLPSPRGPLQNIPLAAALTTTLSTQLLQLSAFTSTFLSHSISSSINASTDIFGLSATTGVKFLALIWIAYVSAQAANIYWVNIWFVKFRTVAFKRRVRTEREMQAGYKAIWGEVRGDFRVGREEDTEGLVKRTYDIRHWDENFRKM